MGDFPIYNALNYKGQPDLSQRGLLPLVLTDRLFYRSTGPNRYDTSVGDETATRKLAASVPPGVPLVLDIEHWPLDLRTAAQADVEASIARIRQIRAWIKAERPDLIVGLYGVPPIRDYWSPVNYRNACDRFFLIRWWQLSLKGFQQKYDDWIWANQNLQILAEPFDWICPSLYLFYADQPSNQYYIEENLDQAAQYDKPVVPFAWFEYHDSTALAGQPIALNQLLQLAALVGAKAQGLVLWGGNGVPWSNRISMYVSVTQARCELAAMELARAA